MSHSVAIVVMFFARHKTPVRRFAAVASNHLISVVRRFCAGVRAAVCGGCSKTSLLLAAAVLRRFAVVSPHTPPRACARARGAALRIQMARPDAGGHVRLVQVAGRVNRTHRPSAREDAPVQRAGKNRTVGMFGGQTFRPTRGRTRAFPTLRCTTAHVSRDASHKLLALPGGNGAAIAMMSATQSHTPLANGSPRNAARLGPHSRAIDRGSVGWSIDGRSREGRFLRAYEAMLAEHVGGKPSRVQAEMIRRCARLALHLELQDEKTLAAGDMSDGVAKRYLAWNGALVRTLRELGLKATGLPRRSLAERLAEPAAAEPAPRRASVAERLSSEAGGIAA